MIDYPTIIVPRKKVLIPKTIIVDGISGSGKTTVAKLISDELDCPTIHGDPLMFNSVPLLQNQMEFTFGERPGSENGFSYLTRQFQPTTIKKERALPNITRNCVEEQIEWIENNPDAAPEQYYIWLTERYGLTSKQELKWMLDNFKTAVYNSNPSSDKVVEEFYTSNKFKRWTGARERLMMNPNLGKRTEILIDRARQQGLAANPELPEIRRKAISPLLQGAKYVDYIVPNEFDNSLKDEVHYICKDMKERGIV